VREIWQENKRKRKFNNCSTEAPMEAVMVTLMHGSMTTERFKILLAREQFKIGNRLNWLTFVLVVVGLLNVVVLAFQIWGKH